MISFFACTRALFEHKLYRVPSNETKTVITKIGFVLIQYNVSKWKDIWTCGVSEFAPLKSNLTSWSSTKRTSMSYHGQVNCDILTKIKIVQEQMPIPKLSSLFKQFQIISIEVFTIHKYKIKAIIMDIAKLRVFRPINIYKE